jgi:hypothetical protein
VVAPSARSPETTQPELISQVAERVRELAGTYGPPAFSEVPDADAALFLCAIDHRTGYRNAYKVDGRGPFDGSALLWNLGCAAQRRSPGALSARSLAEVAGQEVEEMFRIGEETLAGAERRAELWRDLAAVLERRYDGSAPTLIRVSGSRLGGEGGLIARLAEFDAYADPLAKKAFLFAKIAARRGWLTVVDPESWQVCADNVLMRLALRAGLVQPGAAEAVRAATRDVFCRVGEEAGVEPPLLDDLLWELGRRDPDLLGTAGGAELREPPRPEGTIYY